ncbi:MAG TPA: TonB-dependent receptor [Cytophagaceae bacterium]
MINKVTYHFLLLLAGLLPVFLAHAQSYHTVSGKITDAATNEPLTGAVIAAPDLKKMTSTDMNGTYSINLPEDSVTLIISYFGYLETQRKIFVNKNIQLNVALSMDVTEMEEVIIEGNTEKNEVTTTQMSTITLTPKEARLVPALLGEVDLIKVLQLKPGIQSGGEGSSGLYIRGGGPDQNLILLDNAPVYNASHLFGFFSIFNPDAVSNVRLYKGGFPAQFGGRLSSVVEIDSKDGNKEKMEVKGGIGLIATRLSVEGPVKKGKSSFIVSGRRTYFDLFTRRFNEWNKDNKDFQPIPDYFFHDFNAKFNTSLGEKDKLELSAYYGKDFFKYSTGLFNFNFNWKNVTASLQWTHIYNSRLISKSSFIYSQYDYEIKNSYANFLFTLGSGVRDFIIKSDFDYHPNNKHIVKLGIQATSHLFNVARFKASSQEHDVSFESGKTLNATDMAVYFSDDYSPHIRWKINYGVRLTGFINEQSFYHGIEPRMSARYLINDKISLKASYARMFQYIHLASNSGASLPTDIWYPSTATIKPQRSDQVATGIIINLKDDNYVLTNEIYYKWLKGVIDFKDGAEIFANQDLDKEFVFGKGWCYGNELYLEKKKGKLTGWIGYTLSWTNRQFNEINDGKVFPARYDRRHDISIVSSYKLSKRVNITTTWVYGTGNAVSLPVARFLLQDVSATTPNIVPIFTDRNSFRLPSYHRMDVGLVWDLNSKRGKSDLTFSIYNVYDRRNAYFIYYEEVMNMQGIPVRYKAKQVSLFPIIPSVTYNFKF